MKTGFRMRHCLPLSLLVGLALAGRVAAQTFENLHSFNASDGAVPFAGLVLSSNTLYGTTLDGGGSDLGSVFGMKTDGTGFKTVHQFSNWQWPYYTNSDGAHPKGGLILSGNTLYGMTSSGGSSANGTLFAVKTDGSGFSVLHQFTSTDSSGAYTNDDGASPYGGLVLSSNTLYGTTIFGGNYGNGTIFAVETDGTSFMVLHHFTTAGTISFGVYTNGDGAQPCAGLVLSSNTLYGTTISGGSYGNGTIFSVHTDGSAFTTLHTLTDRDGAGPYAALNLSSNTLYGTAAFGGSYGNGTIFSLHTDGTGFTTLHNFTIISDPSYTNSDGANPQSELILSGNRMFGSARLGGGSGSGTVFVLNIDGTGFTTLHDFDAQPIDFPTNTDGYYPSGGLVLSSNVLYGTARYGGSYCNGTIFSVSLPEGLPQLTVIASGENLILAWETNHAGFDYSGFILQSTTNLASPVWISNLPGPVVVNGEYTVTTPISGTQQFFRLGQ